MENDETAADFNHGRDRHNWEPNRQPLNRARVQGADCQPEKGELVDAEYVYFDWKDASSLRLLWNR